ncbi:MAG: type II secretion system F family protein [Phycisphaerales bacterium]
MSVWRYEAVDLRDPARPATRRGEVSGANAAEARAAIRAAGLEVLRVVPERAPRRRAAEDSDSTVDRWLRGRRAQERADLFDALANLLDSGVPLLEAVDTLCAAGDSMRRPLRRALVSIREGLRAGQSLSESMRDHAAWFDRAELAAVEAAQVGGTLAETLHDLAERQARGARLGSRLVTALAYPAVVLCAGVLVSVFLATRTLPQLVSILRSAKLEPPRLTLATIAFGEALLRWWPVLAIAAAALLVVASAVAPRLFARASPRTRARVDRAIPLVMRRLALSRALRRVGELLRSGVPLVEALRVAAPSCRGFATGLAVALRRAADSIEGGSEAAEALDAPGWFDAELRRLVAVGEAGSGLEPVLARLAERYERQADRLVERLSSLLEPAAIVVLAALVGTVVMSAVLPLARLQEILS